ncbi:alpha-galactosidase [Conexibacter sp. CPCC 206217]|uniref:alpha-galactosidase n=1 Tax=Conexibacter sp. CPCC 206217 TaxID=3064574 RepID=UPI002718FACD|nr:alpha-galactosidase [Conexibacter sp. CPCC 206217]MDO8210346.1 alpha-galactosidase [Conexibacter sp. CPCC 206217]
MERDVQSGDRSSSRSRFNRRDFLAGGAAGAGALVLASAFPSLVRAGSGAAPAGALDDLLAAPPFSFTYGGVGSAGLLARWPQRTTTQTLANGAEQTTVTWTDATSGLIVRWTATEYPGYPNLSWIVEFENGGRSNSSTLADVLAVDLDVAEAVAGPAGSDWTIHTGIGSNQSVHDFRPIDVPLASRAHRLFTTAGGRPSSFRDEPDTSGSYIPNGWPYYNVEWGGQGIVLAIGWPGQWGVEVNRTDRQALTLRGGMCTLDDADDGDHIAALNLTQLWLAPGESIRTPMIVLQPWSEDGWLDAQNTWRRWMVDYHLQRDQGRPPQPHLSATHYSFGATQADHFRWLDGYADHGQTLVTGGRYDHYWIDAGWYQSASATDWQPTGTWEVNTTRFPNGLAPVTDRARELGLSTILWFEPERVRLGTWLASSHPEWLIQPPAGYVGFLGSRDDRLFDFGDPDALAWAIATFNGLLEDQHVNDTYRDVSGFYREDSNIEPLPYWNEADLSGRRGLTQARYVEGHLAYWAAILAANPTLQIDTCASGGRRVDVQSLQYAIPLLRSDLVRPPVAAQCQNYGLSLWLPVSGNQAPANSDPGNGYVQRSAMTACFDMPVNVDDPATNWTALTPLTAEWAAIADSYLGDYHPLTAYSDADDAWMAWQYNARDADSGFVQAFRRPGSGTASQRLLLRGLDRAATYALTSYAATTQSWTASSGFSARQGDNQWRYLMRNKSTGAFTDNTYRDNAWYGPLLTSGGYVAASSQHPDDSYDAVRRWVAPVAGVVCVTGRAYKQDVSGGNGVIASVLHNGTTLWTRTIAYDDATGYTTDVELSDVPVSAGDTLSFVVANNGGYANDATIWDPTVTLVQEESWSASTGFSARQGDNQWRYEARAKSGGAYSDATYRSGAWYTPGNGYVNAGSMHPDNSYDAVRTWVSPLTGVVRIGGRAYKQDVSGGNGVIVSVLRNGTTLWTRTLRYDDATGHTTNVELDKVVVSAGDSIRFVISNNGDWSNDATYWDPTISVVTEPSWTASADFSDTQGADQWRYQARAKSGGAYTDGSYRAGAWYGPLSTAGAYVAAGSMHPDNSYDAVRAWVAPCAGNVRISGRVRKQDTGGGNGVIASVLLNGTTLWTRTVRFDDAGGYTTSADLQSVAVSAGDTLRFVVANNGDYAYDATYWDPTITLLADPDPVTTSSRQTGAQLEDSGLAVSLGSGTAVTVTYERQ